MALGTHEAGVAADETRNNTLDRTAGSRSLAVSGQRERYAAETGERAMRDWLDWRRLARSPFVRLRRRRRSRRPVASRA